MRGVTNNCLGVVLVLSPVWKREDWEVAGWSTDLNLKGCSVIGRGESGQLYCSSLLSIRDMTAVGECIQSEALNVDAPTGARHSLWDQPAVAHAVDVQYSRLNTVCTVVSHITQSLVDICLQRCMRVKLSLLSIYTRSEYCKRAAAPCAHSCLLQCVSYKLNSWEL